VPQPISKILILFFLNNAGRNLYTPGNIQPADFLKHQNIFLTGCKIFPDPY